MKHGAPRCCRPAVTPGHGQPQLLVPPILGGTEAPQGQEHGWEEMTAPTAMGLPPIWFLSVLNRRAEAGAPISTASSVHPHSAPDTCCAMQAAPAHPSSASPQSDEPPQAPRSLYQPQYARTPGRPPALGAQRTQLQTRALPSTRPLHCLPGTLLPSLRAEQVALPVPGASQSESARSSQSRCS